MKKTQNSELEQAQLPFSLEGRASPTNKAQPTQDIGRPGFGRV
jgi:hypothetical protein